MADKIDSNITGLRYAKESALGVLPGTEGADAVWKGLEPNSYSDFGGQIATVARNPINASRQRQKGVTTDLDASGGFNQDMTFDNTTDLLQGFFFANMRQKATSAPINGVPVALTAILASADDYTAASGLPATLVSGDLILAQGFGVTANNGVKTVNGASSGTAISVSNSLTDEASPPAAAQLDLVGHEFASGDITLALNGGLLQMVSAAFTMTSLPLIPGEWVFLGGDAAAEYFTGKRGFARVKRVTATFVEFDKTTFTTGVEASGAGKTIRIFYGSVIRNEPDPANIVRQTYQLERTLGLDGSGTMSEVLVGAVANELSLNVAQADKMTVDLSFIAINNEQRDGATGVKAGTRPTLVASDAYNTSSDFSRIKLSLVEDDADILPLFAYATELSLTVNNNASPNKAIGVLGAFDVSIGTFEVGGSVTAYFSSIEGVEAVRENANLTLDMILAKANKGILFDIPLLALGDGRPNVEQDQAIMLPLENNAAQSPFGHTLLFQSFPYLPDAAA